MYACQIIETIKIAKSNGLNIPVIYNTNGYENVETIKVKWLYRYIFTRSKILFKRIKFEVF